MRGEGGGERRTPSLLLPSRLLSVWSSGGVPLGSLSLAGNDHVVSLEASLWGLFGSLLTTDEPSLLSRVERRNWIESVSPLSFGSGALSPLACPSEKELARRLCWREWSKES